MSILGFNKFHSSRWSEINQISDLWLINTAKIGGCAQRRRISYYCNYIGLFSPQLGVRSIALKVYVCIYACIFVRLYVYT